MASTKLRKVNCHNEELAKLASVNEPSANEHNIWIGPPDPTVSNELSNESTGVTAANETKTATVLETWKHFCDTTTGHGFARLTRSNQSVKCRVLWSALLLILLAILITSVVNITATTFGNRNVYHDQVLKTNDSMMFPDIHLCESSLFNRSRLKAFGINDTMATYLALSLSATLTSEIIRNDVGRQVELDQELRRLVAPHGRIDVVLKNVTLQCQEIVAGCVRFTVSMNSSECCRRYFGDQVHLNKFGACVSTHNQPDLEEYLPSQATGLILYIKTNTDRMEFDPSIIAPATGMKKGVVFAIEDRFTHTYSALSYKGLSVAPGYWATIPISLHIVDNQDLRGALLAPYSCIDKHHGESLKLAPGFNSYSKLNCKMATVQRYVEEELNCSAISIPTNSTLPMCYPSQIIDFFTIGKLQLLRNYERDLCIIDCVEYNYMAKISTAKITLATQHYNSGWDENSLVGLHFYFPSFTYTFTKNHPESVLKWLADVGGNMGLYMGASLVTVVEVLFFLVRCLVRASGSWLGRTRAVDDTGMDITSAKR